MASIEEETAMVPRSPWVLLIAGVFCLLLFLFAEDDTVATVSFVISFLAFVGGGIWLFVRLTEALGITKLGEWSGEEAAMESKRAREPWSPLALVMAGFWGPLLAFFVVGLAISAIISLIDEDAMQPATEALRILAWAILASMAANALAFGARAVRRRFRKASI